MEKSDHEVFIEGGVNSLKFGGAEISVDALNIESSVQWVRRVRSAWFEQVKKNQEILTIATRDTKAELEAYKQSLVDGGIKSPDLEKLVEEKDKSFDSKRIEDIEAAMMSGAGQDVLFARDMIVEYDSKKLAPEIVNQGTAAQIVDAFELLLETESNPTRRLRAAMNKG